MDVRFVDMIDLGQATSQSCAIQNLQTTVFRDGPPSISSEPTASGHVRALAAVMRSDNRARDWKRLAMVPRMWWRPTTLVLATRVLAGFRKAVLLFLPRGQLDERP